jgi:hypothetical protein
MSESMKVFEATFDKETKQFEVKIFTTHLPYITFAQKLLDLQITDKMLELQMKEKSNIVLPEMGVKV